MLANVKMWKEKYVGKKNEIKVEKKFEVILNCSN